jgi:hypothetical protein
MSDIALIEWHDGVVEHVALAQGGRVSIAFSHLAVYERRAPDLYDIVSYGATVTAHGTTEVSCTGTLAPSSRVDLVRIDGNELSAGRTVPKDRAKSGGALEVLFGGGTVLSLVCNQLTLELGTRNAVVETWAGQL